MLFTPLMASDKSRVASGGAGNEDPEENANDYDPGWRDERHFLVKSTSWFGLWNVFFV